MIDWKPVKKVKNQYGQPRSFLPNGRSEQIIYAVTLHDQPHIVKIGRTTRWHTRRKPYANWNLSRGNGISAERVFRITDEFVDLKKLEAAILQRMPFDIAHGEEWFKASLDEVCRIIDMVLLEYELTYL